MKRGPKPTYGEPVTSSFSLKLTPEQREFLKKAGLGTADTATYALLQLAMTRLDPNLLKDAKTMPKFDPGIFPNATPANFAIGGKDDEKEP